MKFLCLVFSRMSGESNRRRFKSLLLCSCDVVKLQINSLCLFFRHKRSGSPSVSDWNRRVTNLIIIIIIINPQESTGFSQVNKSDDAFIHNSKPKLANST